jgi:S-DNA-T family DNA segregation ATPase FtsK/SpoIIIE
MSEVPLDGEDAPEFEGAEDEGADAEVIQLPTAAAAPVKPRRGEPGEWKPVVPEHLRTPEGRRKAASWHWKRAKHHAAYHGVRSPWRLLLTVVYAGVGLARIVAVQLAWWWLAEQTFLRHKSIADGETDKYLRLHKHAREVRLVRGVILLIEVTAVAIGASLLSSVSLLLWIPFGLVAVPLLAYLGRPDGKPILTSSVVPLVIESLTIALIVRALGALGIAEMNKALKEDAGKAVSTLDGPMRDGPGWLWRGELPPGVTAAMVSEKREEFASGLRRPLGCVWPETDAKRHPGALNLFVSDEDMTTAEQPSWPLAKRGAANLFKPALFGYDPRAKAVTVTLMFVSIIIGSVPRMGKTFLLRLLLLIAALDVRSEIHAYDLKGTGDLAPARAVAHAYGVGDEPEDMALMIGDFRGLRKEMRRRTKVIRDIAEADPSRCPENKITDELASDPRLGLHPIVIAVDECQIAFEHPAYGEEFELICTDLAKRGPALGMLIILATQRPDAKSIPPGIRANAVLRMCLYVTGQVENDMVLGTSQYKQGIRATMFGFDAKGVLYFGGEGLRPRIMRAQYIDGPLARLIFARARLMRERAGRVTGYAAGEDFATDTRSFARDVLEVFGDNDKLYGETIAVRLGGTFGEAYDGITKDAVLSQLRALEIPVKSVREPGGKPLAGCERAAVQAYVDGGGLSR